MTGFNVAIFEDETYENFLPLTYTRPVFDLKSGAKTFRSRIADLFRGSEIVTFTRDYLAAYIESKEKRPANRPDKIDDTTLFLNGLLIPEKDLEKRLSKVSEGQIGVKNGRLVFALFSARKAREFAERLTKPLTTLDVSQLERSASDKIELQEAKILAYPWEIIRLNAETLRSDLSSTRRQKAGKIHPRATILGRKSNLSVGRGSVVAPGATIDTRRGPVYIARNSMIEPNSWIQGPSFIGSGTRIFPFSRVHGGSTIGDFCAVGGEVKETVLHGHTDKAHAGFIGYSYVGEWVDLGALTTNSHTKDTYGTVEVSVRGQNIDTGQTNLGTFIGDQVKTSVGVMMYTGKKIGVAARLHGVVSEDVPSFMIYAKTLGGKPTEAFFESVIELQRRMYNMRKVEHTAADITLLKRVYDLTREERKAAGVVKGRFLV